MTTQKKHINKINRPKISAVFQRKRLFQLLDGCRTHPVTWVSSPAGAGKTTLVASYLESRDLPSIWYQIDQRDADPATFFYYMGMAIKQASPRKRKPLPLLTPEYMLGLDTFALRYFEMVYEHLSPPMVLVIDNYQIIPPDSILHQLILNGLSIIPEGLTAIIIGHRDPNRVFTFWDGSNT